MIKAVQIPIGDEMVATIPYPMSEEDFEMLVATLTLWKRRLCNLESEGSGKMICGGCGSIEPPDFLKEELPSQGWYAFCPSCKRRTSGCAYSEFALSEWKKGKFI